MQRRGAARELAAWKRNSNADQVAARGSRRKRQRTAALHDAPRSWETRSIQESWDSEAALWEGEGSRWLQSSGMVWAGTSMGLPKILSISVSIWAMKRGSWYWDQACSTCSVA